jgi:hypothetical protein
MKTLLLIFLVFSVSNFFPPSKTFAQIKKVVYNQEITLVDIKDDTQLENEIKRKLLDVFAGISDSAMINSAVELLKSEIKPERNPNLVLEIKNDSIWRFNQFEEGQISNMELLFKKDGRLIQYDPFRSLPQGRYDQFSETDGKATLTVNSNERKTILGFDCFLVSIKVENLSSPEWGYSVKLYVTEEISLPLHAAIKTQELRENFFPLEFTIEEYFPVQRATKFTVVEIEK